MTTLQRRRILLVDDDPAGAELTMAAIAMVDPEACVDVVADGEEALDYVFRRGPFVHHPEEMPGAVLLDLKMPKVDGHEVLRQIRGDPHLRAMRVYVLTSSDQARDRVLSQELGSDGYLVKPASIAGLIDLLRGCADLLPPGELSPT
jgi:DNA-binding response OmpR family regulator